MNRSEAELPTNANTATPHAAESHGVSAAQTVHAAATAAGATTNVVHVADPSTPALTVVVPLFNECGNVLEILSRVRSVNVSKEVLLVDDGSTDGTTNVLHESVEGRFPDVRVLYHDENRGKGAAIRTAIPHAKGEFLVIQDGDLEYDPRDFVPIMEAFRTGADAVYGSRFLAARPRMRFANRAVNRLLAWMVRALFHVPMTDEATCYKAFRTEVLKSLPLTCRRFEFCPEVTGQLLRRGYRIVEVPIRYEPRTVAQGKKIRWTDGVQAIWTLLKVRFARV